jgi:hypothetical protein
VCLAGENPGDDYSVLIVVTGLALLIKYVQITTVYSLFSGLVVDTVHDQKALNISKKSEICTSSYLGWGLLLI